LLISVLDLISDPVTHLEQCWMPSSLTSLLYVSSCKRSLLLRGREVYVGIMVRPGLRAKCYMSMITQPCSGPRMVPSCRYCMCVRPCLKVRPGIRARCCLYMITHSGDPTDLAMGPERIRLAGTACPHVCETLSQGQIWPQRQVLPVHDHTFR
jgi:hypothetical protein